MQQHKVEESKDEKEIICRKCNAVYVFGWIIFFVILLMMFICLFTLDLWSMWDGLVIQFFFLVELVVAIAIFELYMNILIIWKNSIRFESGILIKSSKETPYNKINSVNIHSAFWFGTLEILTGNDTVTRYKYLENYKEVEKIINERITNKQS